MKNSILIWIAAAVLCAPIASRTLKSQQPAADPFVTLEAIKAGNAELLKKQEATLKTLEEVSQTAVQIRTMAART